MTFEETSEGMARNAASLDTERLLAGLDVRQNVGTK
jgi:hypothetical protein